MSTHAASGVIPLLNFLLCRIEDIQSAITEISLLKIRLKYTLLENIEIKLLKHFIYFLVSINE